MAPDVNEVKSLVGDFATKRIDRRQFLARAVAIGISASAAGVLLEACGGSATPGGASASSSATTFPLATKTLTYRPQFDIANLDPAFFVNEDDLVVADCILEGLVSYRPGTWEVVNTLAESFEPSSDKLRYHFKLKQGIEWQKGYGEVRASDVKFSFERIAGLTKPNINAAYQGDWQALESVKVEGPYAGTIILKEPFAPLMASTLPVGSGKVVPQKAVEALGKKWSTNIVGSGPFEFVSWVPGQHLTLKRFDKYGGANASYAAKTPWTEIETDVVTSDETALAALQQAGSALLMSYLGTSTVKTAQSTPSLKVYSKATQGYYFLAMNVTDSVLQDKNVRKAVRAAVDVPGVISAAYQGLATRAYGIIPPSMSVGYWADAPKYEQDIALAKKYLAQSGLGKVSLRLYTQNDQSDSAAAQIIASNLGQAGIDVTIEAQPAATYYQIPGSGGGGKARQLAYGVYTTEPDPYWSYIWWTCSQMNLWNWDNWCNPQFSSLVNKAFRTYDTAERNSLYTQAAQMWDEEAGIVWICYPNAYYAAQPHVVPSLRPDGTPVLWNTGVV